MDNSDIVYELIVTVVDRGFSERVMDAAKSKGARGCTVLHARGTGSKEAMQFFNITVQQEKDIIIIVAPKDIRSDIMREIAIANSLEGGQGTGITFSLPVDSIVGLRKNSNNAAPVATLTEEADKPTEQSDKTADEENKA